MFQLVTNDIPEGSVLSPVVFVACIYDVTDDSRPERYSSVLVYDVKTLRLYVQKEEFPMGLQEVPIDKLFK